MYDEAPRFLKWLDNLTKDATEGKDRDYGFSISQFLYTPSDIEVEENIEGDRPYAAWLYGGFSMTASDENQMEYVELDIGITGPRAFGEGTQTTVHEWVDSKKPLGWDNQIGETIGIDLTYQRKYRYRFGEGSFQADVVPHIGGTVGNIHQHVNLGATCRVGYNLPNDFGFIRIEPSPRVISAFENIGFYIFTSVDGRYVFKNILVDGNGGVTKEKSVYDYSVGASLITSKFDLVYAYTIRTPEIKEQDRDNKFGTIMVSYKF